MIHLRTNPKKSVVNQKEKISVRFGKKAWNILLNGNEEVDKLAGKATKEEWCKPLPPCNTPRVTLLIGDNLAPPNCRKALNDCFHLFGVCKKQEYVTIRSELIETSCSNCNEKYHPSCVFEDEDIVNDNELETWLCPICDNAEIEAEDFETGRNSQSHIIQEPGQQKASGSKLDENAHFKRVGRDNAETKRYYWFCHGRVEKGSKKTRKEEPNSQ